MKVVNENGTKYTPTKYHARKLVAMRFLHSGSFKRLYHFDQHFVNTYSIKLASFLKCFCILGLSLTLDGFRRSTKFACIVYSCFTQKVKEKKRRSKKETDRVKKFHKTEEE